MASIQVRKETGNLIIDFYYKGVRCREHTALSDTVANRKKVQKLLERIEAEMMAGTFDYQRFFPGSKKAKKFEIGLDGEAANQPSTEGVSSMVAGEAAPSKGTTPLVREFAETWFVEKEVEWRHSHRRNVRADLDGCILPRWGDWEVGQITKADILGYRAELAKVQVRSKGTTLSNRRINRLVNLLRQIVNEASDRFNFRTPFQNIKQLKVKRTDVDPFSLEEVKKIIDTVRPDFRNYFTVRFLTGTRTAEIDGLKWKYVDFERRLILIRETYVYGRWEYTKTDGSQRDIQMSQTVFDALKAQEKITRDKSEVVFCNRNGAPLDSKNVADRVWYPLLRHLGLTKRRPYQTRHTAATLWLAAGENPEWIAMQMGHTTTEMLFRVYSRYVPNLTRKDGSAFERLLLQSGTGIQSDSNTKNGNKTQTGEDNYE